jgi:hypothetical protein
MNVVEFEGEWLASLSERPKLIFLASLSHSLTIAGRDSYVPQSEALEKPEQLRKVNEIQHRVSACMLEVLAGGSNLSFQRSIAALVLAHSDAALVKPMHRAWASAKERACDDA